MAVVLTMLVVLAWHVPQRSAAHGQMSTVWSAVYTNEQATRGEELHNRECAFCHIADSGNEYAPPLTGEAFLYRWDGKTVEDLFRKIATTMPWDRPGALSKEASANILAHILKMNGFPAGPAPLNEDSVILRQIRISRTP